MKKVNIKINEKEISEQKADEYKSFDKVLTQHKGTIKFYKKSIAKKIISTIAVASIMGGGLLYFNSDKDKTIIDQPTKTEITQGINKPFPDLELEYETFEISNDNELEIITKNGSIINIPKNAFEDSDGNLVKGKVTLKYKEYRDMADVFLSGIPMTYDSAGNQYHFQSAGMFELNGLKDETPIQIAENKNIEVDFASDYDGDEFNQYEFDTKDNEWKFIQKDIPIKAHTEDVNDIKISTDENLNIEDDILEPQLAAKNAFKIKIDVLEEEFPEIAPYKNVKFQLIEDEDFDPSLSQIEWDYVKVTKEVNDTYNYLLGFQKGKRIETFKCMPVFEEED